MELELSGLRFRELGLEVGGQESGMGALLAGRPRILAQDRGEDVLETLVAVGRSAHGALLSIPNGDFSNACDRHFDPSPPAEASSVPSSKGQNSSAVS